MANWVDESMDTLMAGIEAEYWVSFFKLFSEGRPKEEIEAELSNIARKVRQAGRPDHKGVHAGRAATRTFERHRRPVPEVD